MDVYISKVLFPFKDGFLGFVGGPEHLAARELRQGDMQFEFGDNGLYFLMDVPEFTVPEFRYFGFPSDLIFDFHKVHYFIIELCLMPRDLNF